MYYVEYLTEDTYSHPHQVATYVEEVFSLSYTARVLDIYEILEANCGENASMVFINAVHPTSSAQTSIQSND